MRTNVAPETLIGLKEDAVTRLLSRLGLPHKVASRDGKQTDDKPVKVKSNVLVLDVHYGVVTGARNLL